MENFFGVKAEVPRKEQQPSLPSWKEVVERLGKKASIVLSFSLLGCPAPQIPKVGQVPRIHPTPAVDRVVRKELPKETALKALQESDKEQVRTSELATILRKSPDVLAEANVSPEELEKLIDTEFLKIHAKLKNGDIILTVHTKILKNGFRVKVADPDMSAIATYSYPIEDYTADRNEGFQHSRDMLSLPITTVDASRDANMELYLKELNPKALGLAYYNFQIRYAKDMSMIADGIGDRVEIRPLTFPPGYPVDFIKKARHLAFRRVLLQEFAHHVAYFDHSDDPKSFMYYQLKTQISLEPPKRKILLAHDEEIFTDKDGILFKIALDRYTPEEDPASKTIRLLSGLGKRGIFDTLSTSENTGRGISVLGLGKGILEAH